LPHLEISADLNHARGITPDQFKTGRSGFKVKGVVSVGSLAFRPPSDMNGVASRSEGDRIRNLTELVALGCAPWTHRDKRTKRRSGHEQSD
jgi:hypothetical protein